MMAGLDDGPTVTQWHQTTNWSMLGQHELLPPVRHHSSTGQNEIGSVTDSNIGTPDVWDGMNTTAVDDHESLMSQTIRAMYFFN